MEAFPLPYRYGNRNLISSVSGGAHTVKKALDNFPYIHGRSHQAGRDSEHSTRHGKSSRPSEDNMDPFDGVLLDTCANVSSVMGRTEYYACLKYFGPKPSNRQGRPNKRRAIGGKKDASGIATIKISMKALRLDTE